MMPRLARFALPLVLFLASVPLTRAGAPDMSALWPNTDGLSWTYAQRTEELGTSPVTTDRVLRMLFDGTSVAPVGIGVQVLRGELLSGPITAGAGADPVRDPFLRSLLRARPELAPAIRAAGALAQCPTDHPAGFDAVLLGGGFAYLKTAGEISAWRCLLANTRAWTWLVSDLTPGNTFTLQLVPDLASDVFLHGTLGGMDAVTVPAGTFASCQRVDYWIDYGLSSCTDESGGPLGTFRSATRGSVYYAAGVGPVMSTEAFIPYDEMDGTCVPLTEVGQPLLRVTMQLTSMPVPTVASSWGRIKTRDR